jgi:hypothetical protein
VVAFDSLEVAEHGSHLIFKLVYFLFGGGGGERDEGFPNLGLTVDRRLDEAGSEQSYRVGTDSTAVSHSSDTRCKQYRRALCNVNGAEISKREDHFR